MSAAGKQVVRRKKGGPLLRLSAGEVSSGKLGPGTFPSQAAISTGEEMN